MVPKKKYDTIEDMLKSGLLVRGNDDSLRFDRISFGLPALDRLVGGGVPTKRYTLLTGPTNTGKSYLASQIVRSAQKSGEDTAWIDAEWSWDVEWMAKCGVDVSKIYVIQPNNAEQAFDVLRALMRNSIRVAVLDSIAGLAPEVMHDENFAYNPMAWQARFINAALPKLTPNLKYGTSVVFINQVRSSMGPVYLDNMPGGIGQVFFSHMILQCRRSGWIEERDIRVGFDMEIRCRKTKVGGEAYQSCVVPFRLEGGIDVVETYIREFLDKDLIQQSGAWYKIGEEKAQGMNGVKKFFLENPEKFEEMKGML